MPTFTFSGYRDDQTTVTAATEQEARHLAMLDRWGPPRTAEDRRIYGSHYSGLGLTLVSRSQD